MEYIRPEIRIRPNTDERGILIQLDGLDEAEAKAILKQALLKLSRKEKSKADPNQMDLIRDFHLY